MKNYLKSILLFSFIYLFSIQNTYACHALALANINQQVIGPTSVFVNAASTAPTCGCGVYWLDVEVRCLNEAFDGVPFNPANWLGLNTYPYFQSATMLKAACVLQNYPGVTIPFAGLCPGLTYQYRMRENNNGNAGPWSAAQTFTVPGAVQPLVAAAATSNAIICAGDCINLTSVVAQGCSLSATYTWDNGIGAVQNPTNICPAVTTTYCVTIVEQCSNFNDQACVTVNVVPPPVNGTAAVAPSTFCGTANPVLSIAGHQGLIQWQSAPNAGGPWTNIAGGTTTPFNPPQISGTTCYQAVITGCGAFQFTSNVVCVTLVIPTPPNMTFTNETCDALNDGTATATPVAMTAPITYSWVPSGQNTQTATGLAPGTYTVTVSDANGCIETGTVTILPGPLVVAGFTPPTNQCLTGNSYTFNNTGTTGVTYAWDFGNASGTSTQENPSYTYPAAGTYTVTQTVTSGPCSDVFVTNVTVYDMPLPTATNTPLLCNGDNTGTATVPLPITNGTGPYTYSWNPSGQATNPATVLPAGNYTVTVTDANGCIGTATTVITEPAVLTVTEAHVDPSCNGFSDGTATATGLGGTPGYTYSWNTVPVQNAQTAVGLTAGTYICTITDANGCTATVNAILVTPPPIVLNPSMVAANCGQPDGSTNVTVTSGGVGPFTYSWDTAPVQNTQAATNVPAGTYTVTVTDQSNGCTQTAIIVVTTTAGITATATFIQDVQCFSGNDGQASAAPTGGTGPYTYSWNTVPVQTGSSISTTAGTYTVVITDAFGCTGNDVVTINEPTPLTLSLISTINVSCFGASDGSATVAGGGATPGYTYQWDAATGNQTGATATGLPAGNYGVTVTDANGCSDVSILVTILDGPQMSSTVTGTDVTCFGGNNGAADLTPIGGTGPYTYNWTPSGSGAEDPNGLQAGTHYVTITSQEGCTVNDTIIITEPTAVVAVVDSSFDVICNGASDGLAFASASGGTPGYTYSWNSAPVQNTANATGLPFGPYTVTVTDANGCITTAIANINEPAALVATTGSIDAYCSVDQGTVWISPTSGTGPYTHTWDSAGTVIGNLDTLTNLYPGTYNVQLVDANGCIFNTTVTVNPAPGGTASISAFTDVSCFSGSDGTATVSVGGAFPGFTYLWDASAGSQTTNPATGLALGNYNVTVTDTFGCVMTTNVTISEPTALIVNFAPLDNACPDSCNASISAGVAGGTFPYAFQWNDPNIQISGIASGLCSGTYTVIITDGNGCLLTDSALVTEPPAMVLNPTSTPASCNQSDGSVTVVVTANGTAPFTYSWDNGSGVVGTTSNVNNLPAGTYFATVTDASGCPVTDTITVANLSGPSMIVDSVYHVQCFGGNDGYTEVQV
ncbi:MAG: PKD domain-containing protein, partial [Flavobacteriales bacterium]|nr:PKD domain-containing protein [Flavobacteriales bacterium]